MLLPQSRLDISLSPLPSFFAFLALFFFSFAGHLLGFISVGKVLGKAFCIIGVDGRMCWWVVTQDFQGSFLANFTEFFVFYFFVFLRLLRRNMLILA